ncbi:MAG: hypothetical protein ACE5HC_15995 [Candidatus Binatia bacterium]
MEKDILERGNLSQQFTRMTMVNFRDVIIQILRKPFWLDMKGAFRTSFEFRRVQDSPTDAKTGKLRLVEIE